MFISLQEFARKYEQLLNPFSELVGLLDHKTKHMTE